MSFGWTFRGSAYCQLIRNVNKQKHLEWAQQLATHTLEETSYGRMSAQSTWKAIDGFEVGEAPRPKPR